MIDGVSKENCIRAAADGDVATLRRFFAQDAAAPTKRAADPSDRDAAGDKPAFVDARASELVATLFSEAIENGQLDSVLVLLTLLESHRRQLESLYPALLAQAITEDYGEIVECLLTHGAQATIPVPAGSDADDVTELPPLSLAAQLGSLEIAQMLVARGADVNARADSSGATALHEAARQDDDEMVAFLVTSGASVDVVERAHGETPLHIAVKKGNKRAVEALLRCRANLDAVNALGSSAVHLAQVEGQRTILALLTAAGAATSLPSAPTPRSRS